MGWIVGAQGRVTDGMELRPQGVESFLEMPLSERRQTGEMTAHLRTLLPEARITVGTEVPRSLYVMNNQRLADDLGFKARWTMETGLVDYLNRVRRHAGLPPVAG